MKRFAAAASILLVAGIGVFYLTPKKHSEKPVAQTRITVAPATEHKTISNATSKLMLVQLEDSSRVELFPSSTIKFDAPFPADKRDIVLEGEAKFHVSKNKKKPFTVYADALAVTALGTVFTVKKSKVKNTITVKLFKGKVVIHSTDKNLSGWKNDVYLSPGKQMYFDAVLKTVAINNISSIKPAIAVTQTKAAEGSANNKLEFDNTDLSKVMDKLAAFYKVKIQYDSSAINTMNFSGVVSKNDSLPIILKAIGQMNGLEVITTADGFTIVKP
jgi:transmembrane sensor